MDVVEKHSMRAAGGTRAKSASYVTSRSEAEEEAENQPINRMLLDDEGRLRKYQLLYSMVLSSLFQLRTQILAVSVISGPWRVALPRQESMIHSYHTWPWPMVGEGTIIGQDVVR